ncbi:hypothetical protein [Aeoliella sp.]|uniref:hypothetical protein n=1 Tax=Aeoliella sp. TaxID=2795800 RepID=UPI003CCBA473
MTLKFRNFLFLLVVSAVSGVATAQSIPAFSGASGPGGNATGGRGGDVYHVTTLDADKGGTQSGSLQYGINNAPSAGRTIVFDVGGTIYLEGNTAQDRLRYGKANITIAGQTAPGAGITIAGTGTKWTGDNIILRNIAIRPNVNSNGTTHDAFDLQLKNSIVDHVSASWFTDEGISQTDSGVNSTIQYATIGEGLNYAGHSYGSIISTEVDGTHNSFNHNLYAHNNSRLPRLGSEPDNEGNPRSTVLDWSNNVVYNWSSRAGYSGTVQESRSNFVGNYYIKGPNNGVVAFRGGDDSNSIGFTQIFQSTDPALANKFDDDKDSTLHDGIIFGPTTTLPNSSGQKAYSGSMTFVSTQFAVTGVDAPETADVALDRVLAYGGSNWLNRSPIEQRVVNSVKNNTGGLINDLNSGPQAGEWATVLAQRPDNQGNAPYSRQAGFDTDLDGMPDEWEVEHGLNPGIADNNGDFDADGYTNLEEYINELAEWPAPQPITFNAATNSRYAQISNWDINWQPSKYDTAVINSGTVVVDAVGQHAGSLVLAVSAADNATLNITSGWLKVEDAPHGLSDGIVSIGDNPDATAELNLSGGKLTTNTLLKGAGGTFNFTGGVLSAETIGFDLAINGGTLAPGESIGSTTVLGDVALNDCTLAIELASTSSCDTLNVTGALALGGHLDVSLIDGFAPESGSWVIATAGSFSGTFDSVTSGYAVTEQGGSLVLSVQQGLPGDFNGDGAVTLADYTVWRNNLGAPDSVLPAGSTSDGSGFVDAGDYATWKESFAAMASASLANQPVPEPATAVLCLVGLLGWTLARAEVNPAPRSR